MRQAWGVVTFLACGAAHAQLVGEFDLRVDFGDDLFSWGGLGGSENFFQAQPLRGARYGIVAGSLRGVAIDYDVSIAALPTSQLRDMAVALGPPGVSRPYAFRPAPSESRSGAGQFSGTVDGRGQGGLFVLDSRDVLFMELYETINDFPFSADGVWFAGSEFTITFQAEFDVGGCGPADLAVPFGVLSQLDAAEFVRLFFDQEVIAGAYAEPLGVVSAADVDEFVRLYFEGCASR
ncbi:MAG: hypothetical protein AAFR38_01525 [Planctomycetota bacterium]